MGDCNGIETKNKWRERSEIRGGQERRVLSWQLEVSVRERQRYRSRSSLENRRCLGQRGQLSGKGGGGARLLETDSEVRGTDASQNQRGKAGGLPLGSVGNRE
ncbi:hypothetical protein C1H46_004182 [Malus baccata]|uniref:Uncharacterized protein n=1 Tax=Malus baccata TaxID=106549 RepID=A0A540NI78_MALBA|nr:hypothetical protein C1H46_004182 [Malus baccata]